MDVIDALRAEGEALAAAAAAAADLGATVPTCPAWTVADLVAHVGLFTAQVGGKPWAGNDPYDFANTEVPPPDERTEWYRRLHADLMDALALALRRQTGDDGADVSSVASHLAATPEHFAGMLAREMPIHRWDVENANDAGHATPLLSEVAQAGLDAMFGSFLPAVWGSARGNGELLRFVAADTGGEWGVVFGDDGPQFSPAGPAGPPAGNGTQLTVTATASNLLLLLFARPVSASVDFAGDRSVLGIPWRR